MIDVNAPEINPVPPAISQAEIRRQALKEKKRRLARESLQHLIEYCMPDPEDYDNPEKSRYDAWPHHKILIDRFEKISRKELMRSALSVPPQHGKTTVFGEFGIAFHAARNPNDRIIFGTYAESRAGIVGDQVMKVFLSERFREVFPEFEIRIGECSKYYIGFGERGYAMFVGIGSGASGNPCDLFIIDDPYKGMNEAKSGQTRASVWGWYCGVVEARCPARTPIVIIHTRWSDDDLIGRLCDKDHPEYNPEYNDNFDYLNLPAIVSDPIHLALLGMDKPGALWPGTPELPMWPLEELYKRRAKNPMAFSAIYMGEPIPPEGDFFTQDMIKTYVSSKLPSRLAIYGSSDHAASIKRSADPSVIGTAGLDEKGNIYVLPDLSWQKITTDKQVEIMCDQMKAHNPRQWWTEGDHIKKSIGPFLRLRMLARKVYCYICELSKSGDKMEKAQSIRAMASMGMLYLPIDAPWYPRAVKQLLRFDGQEGRADDFVDFLANIGRGIDQLLPADKAPSEAAQMPETGTAAWVKMAHKAEQKAKKKLKAIGGW